MGCKQVSCPGDRHRYVKGNAMIRHVITGAFQHCESRMTFVEVAHFWIQTYPRFSKFLDQSLSPDVDQVARALARKFRWRIQPSGATALNFLGLSTQVPARAVYLSDGPDRDYQIGNTALAFEHTALKESGIELKESGLIVQALKSLGQEQITPEIILKIRAWLPESLRAKVLADTKTVTGWVYSAIQQIAQ
jgi:hypothetical protein